MPALNIGCSGFSYDHWRGVFYPEGLPKGKWLAHYAAKFQTVELNVTFYRLPRESTFEKWRAETPPGFTFSVKGSRFITHVKRLKDVNEPVGNFFRRIKKPLGEKLAVVLWQFPPDFKSDIERLRRFLDALRLYKARNAFEFRNESWMNDETEELMRREGFGLVMADWPDFLKELPVTADFVYIRRHGHGTYGVSYSSGELEADARKIRRYEATGKDVFIYFNNDAHGYAPENALELTGILGRKRREIRKGEGG